MWKRTRTAILFLSVASGLFAQPAARRQAFSAFEVATIRPTPPEWQGGRYFRMTSPQRFAATNFSPRLLIGVVYNLPPRAVLGGPEWLDSDRYDIVATTPGTERPTLEEQMTMLRQLLTDRFKLTFHREPKEFSIYEISVGKGGHKLKPTMGSPDEDPVLLSQIMPGEVHMPARNASVAQFAAVMQRTIVDRPVIDKTGLNGRFDFDLEWTPDDSQFGGLFKDMPESTKPSLFAAMQEQLGLKLEATKGIVQAIAVDRMERPADN
jgi:uncharacterized protein (TIGR03435 family)